MVSPLKAPAHRDHRTGGYGKSGALTDCIRGDVGDPGCPICVLDQPVRLSAEVRQQVLAAAAEAAKELPVVPVSLGDLTGYRQKDCGVGVGPNGDPSRIEPCRNVVAER